MSKLVFFGCSFTAGHELADHEMLNMTFEECDEFKKRVGSIHEWTNILTKRTKFTKDEIYQKGKPYSWAHKLSQKLQKEHLNLSWPGGSIEYSYLKFLVNHQEGVINPKDKLIVGLTTQARYVEFNNIFPDRIYSIVLSSVRESPDFILEYYNDYKILWNYYKILYAFKKDAESKGYTIKFQPVIDLEYIDVNDPLFFRHFSILSDWNLFPVIQEKWKEIGEQLIDSTSSLFKYGISFKKCAFGHPVESYHEVFASKLYEKIKNENWWK